MIDDLYEKNIKNKLLFKSLGIMVDGYYNWDLFRHDIAIDRFKRARIDEIKQNDDLKAQKFARETEERLIFLRDAVSDGGNGKKPCHSYMLDLYSNAERRFEEGKVDDAILRIYRIVEMGAQERLLNKYEISVSDVKEEKLPESIREEFIKIHKPQRDNKIKISLSAAFNLLDSLGDSLGKTFSNKKRSFLDIQSSRNYSYLAHGFKSSKEDTYIKLRDFVLSLKLFKHEDAPVFPKMEL